MPILAGSRGDFPWSTVRLARYYLYYGKNRLTVDSALAKRAFVLHHGENVGPFALVLLVGQNGAERFQSL